MTEHIKLPGLIAILIVTGLSVLEATQGAAGIRYYDAIVDRLFSATEKDGRYVVAFGSGEHGGEMQIAFSLPFQQDCGLVVWHLPAGSPAIIEQVYDLFEKAAFTPEEAAARVTVMRRRIAIPCDGDLARHLTGIRELALPVPRAYGVAIDGVWYRLTANLGSTRLLYENVGPSMGVPSGDPIIDYLGSLGLGIRDLVTK